MKRVLTTILLLVSVASADTFTFDFENVGPVVPGPTLIVPASNGSPATMTIEWSQPLELENLTLFPGTPPTWGLASLAVFGGTDVFRVTFANLTGGTPYDLTWEIGDFTPSDTDEFIVTTLPSGHSNSGLLDGAIPPFNTRTLSITEVAGISMVLFGQTGGHSLFYDNFILSTSLEAPSTDLPMGGFGGSGNTGTGGDLGRLPLDGGNGNGNGTVPEPTALLLLGVGCAALALRRRK